MTLKEIFERLSHCRGGFTRSHDVDILVLGKIVETLLDLQLVLLAMNVPLDGSNRIHCLQACMKNG